MTGRIVLAALFAVASSVWAVRSAVVEAMAEDRPQIAAKLWPGHPAVLKSLGMTGVGEAAGRGEQPSAETLRRIDALARREPLEPEPFLVRGALAAQSGDYKRAEPLLIAARTRDPRSTAARYLLADLYLRNDRLQEGVTELSVLATLVPGADAQLVPALEQYATGGGDLVQLRRLIRARPGIERRLLAALARDADNAELIVAIAGDRPTATGNWRTILAESMLERGDYRGALRTWSRLSGADEQQAAGLFNPEFRQLEAPPPFNWLLASGSGGVAEPSGDGLRVLHYGRKDVILASQAMLLRPGRYRLEANVSGKVPGDGSIRWSVACLGDGGELLTLPVRSGGSMSGAFSVPAGCEAQRLVLSGAAREMPQSADFRISGLRLQRAGQG